MNRRDFLRGVSTTAVAAALPAALYEGATLTLTPRITEYFGYNIERCLQTMNYFFTKSDLGFIVTYEEMIDHTEAELRDLIAQRMKSLEDQSGPASRDQEAA